VARMSARDARGEARSGKEARAASLTGVAFNPWAPRIRPTRCVMNWLLAVNSSCALQESGVMVHPSSSQILGAASRVKCGECHWHGRVAIVSCSLSP
jgi:hypothetical protein